MHASRALGVQEMVALSVILVTMTRRFLLDERGAAASEYAIILGVIVVASLAAITLFGLNMSQTTTSVYSDLSHTTDTGPAVFGPGDMRTGTRINLP